MSESRGRPAGRSRGNMTIPRRSRTVAPSIEGVAPFVLASEFGYVCAQVISNTAATAGPKTVADYNPTVYTTGADDTDHRGGPYDY